MPDSGQKKVGSGYRSVPTTDTYRVKFLIPMNCDDSTVLSVEINQVLVRRGGETEAQSDRDGLLIPLKLGPNRQSTSGRDTKIRPYTIDFPAQDQVCTAVCVCRRACAVTNNREVPRIGKDNCAAAFHSRTTKARTLRDGCGTNEPFTPPISIPALPLLLSILIDVTSTPAPQLGAECCGAPRFRHRRGLPSASSSGAPLLHSTTSTSETLDEHMAGPQDAVIAEFAVAFLADRR
ncbi:uncharacterized protein B0T23DRAFT_446616 [Neurospora hispaniola]|uniref:Uncharacterized protein n=1 Tax=Neurospora hispaniola TaxID=588809 RepID=A0AAJ0I2B1_9PEZI|nr:hypothetical protein B0T23DRAFT_446616 [Neurospora hispaniola]